MSDTSAIGGEPPEARALFWSGGEGSRPRPAVVRSRWRGHDLHFTIESDEGTVSLQIAPDLLHKLIEGAAQ